METHPVDKAAAIFGSQVVMAARLGVTKAAVNQWKAPGRQVPVEHCVTIEIETKGAVGRRELRPLDWQRIWPELNAAA